MSLRGHAGSSIVYLLLCSHATAQVITTVAGTDWSFPGPTIRGADAPISDPNGFGFDRAGNIYFIDGYNNRVMRQSPDGVLTVIGGNGIAGFSGDGGRATSASMHLRSELIGDRHGGLDVDRSGNVFVADTFNHRVRKITPDGIITTVAGNGTWDFSGDGGPATNASLAIPNAVVVDPSGNLYIADTRNYRIRKVTPGGIISTIAGTGEIQVVNGYWTVPLKGDGGPAINATLPEPVGLALDGSGNLYIADSTVSRVRKISPDGTIVTVAGTVAANPPSLATDGGPATSAKLGYPEGVTVDAAGNLYIADTWNCAIRKVTPDGIIRSIAGIVRIGFEGDGGPATQAKLFQPLGVGVDTAGNVYIADTVNNRVRKITADGIIHTIAGNGRFQFSGDGGLATSAVFNAPQDLALDNNDNPFIVDTGSNRIRRVNSAGAVATVAGNGGTGYSGDGPALNTPIDGPVGLTIDRAGNLYIAAVDNCMVREVTTSGSIVTLAGLGPTLQDHGLCPPKASTGDGGPAKAAELQPIAIAMDAAGNIYAADAANNVVRKLSPGGTISTVAGNGKQGTAPEGAIAISSPLDFPTGLAVDAAGNVFIRETTRVSKLTPAGIITTFAGNGKSGYSGDNGPARNASLGWLTNGQFAGGLAADNAGNLYIADSENNVVRKVDPAGTITTIAGNGQPGFSGDGGLATKAPLFHPSGVKVDSKGNIFIVDWFNNRVRKILAKPPTAQVSPSRLQFAASSGGAIPPAQTITFTAEVPGIAYSAQVSAGANWLKAAPANGTSPTLVEVTADPRNLAPGNYTGTVTFTAPYAQLSGGSVRIDFTVGAALPPAAAIDNTSLSFPFPNSGTPRGQTLTVSNTGGGTVFFIATTATSDSANWLSVSPAGGQVTPSSPVPLAVTADPTGLAPGTYTGTITVTTPAGPLPCAVTMTISSSASALLLSQTGVSFLAIEEGGLVPPQSFGVINLGSGQLPFTVETSTLSTVPWLSAGTASTNSTQTVNVSVNQAGLKPDLYYGLVTVRSEGAANSPQVLTGVLQVLQKGTDLGGVLQPNELSFKAVAGGFSPGSQTVTIYNITGAPKSFRVPGLDPWLVIVPRDATVTPGQPVTMIVQPVTGSLGTGSYRSSINLQFDDGRVRTIGVNLAVTPAATLAAAKNAREIAAVCSPTQLVPALTSLGNDFTVAAGWPVALQAQVQDDCGTPLENGSVVAEFSNGDPPVSLTSLKGGRWDGTWQSNRRVAGVTVTVKATSADQQISGVRQVSGGLGNDALPPVISESQITDAASGLAFRSLAPGSLINITGDRLADQSAKAPAIPWGSSLANTSVSMLGTPLPIASIDPGRIQAVVPYGIGVNTRPQILVQRGNTYSQPVSVNVAAASPAIFVTGGTQAVIYDANGKLVAPGNAAHAGDAVDIYCVGLGVVQENATEGDYGPATSTTATPVAVAIGGKNADVRLCGLTPGMVGVYSVRAVVPDGIDPGDLVQVKVTSLTTPPVAAPAVTMAVQ